MADEKKKKALEERIFTIPLGDVHQSKPSYRRTNKAVAEVRAFLEKNMKSSEVKLDNKLNLLMWKKGISKPPRRVQVKATKDENGVVVAELV